MSELAYHIHIEVTIGCEFCLTAEVLDSPDPDSLGAEFDEWVEGLEAKGWTLRKRVGRESFDSNMPCCPSCGERAKNGSDSTPGVSE